MNEEPFVQVDNLRMTYQEYGPKEAPSLVFVHALFNSARDWENIVPAFERDYHIFVPNLRGHGSTEWTGDYRFENLAEDLGKFLDALDVEKVSLVGHSLGGIISYFFAAQHPERVEKLVLEEGPPPKPTKKQFYPGPKPLFKKPSCDWNAVLAVFNQLNHAKPEWWALAKNITVPTLVIGGGKTSHVPQQWNKELARKIPHGKYVLLSGGHFVHNRHPETFIKTVTEFLSNS